MSWHFSQALVAAFSADTCLDGAPSAPSNLNHTQRLFSSSDRMMEFCRRSPSGMTCEPLTESRGQDVLTSFLAAFPARTSAPLVTESGSTGSDLDCGSKWLESSEKCDQGTLSLKTRRCFQRGGLIEFSLTLPKWGSMHDGVLFQRRSSVLSTNAKECGLWPTPTCGGFTSTGAIKATMRMAASLDEAAAMTGRPGVVEKLSCKKVSYDRKNGQLNPDWVEWLMGWPIGWTGLQPLGMDKFREWCEQHGTSWPTTIISHANDNDSFREIESA